VGRRPPLPRVAVQSAEMVRCAPRVRVPAPDVDCPHLECVPPKCEAGHGIGQVGDPFLLVARLQRYRQLVGHELRLARQRVHPRCRRDLLRPTVSRWPALAPARPGWAATPVTPPSGTNKTAAKPTVTHASRGLGFMSSPSQGRAVESVPALRGVDFHQCCDRDRPRER
jgi:hypothetical protein